MKLRTRFRRVGEKSNYRCWYCGVLMTRQTRAGRKQRGTSPSRDHQTPRVHGGENTPENLVLSCFRCNNEKGSRDVEGYRDYLQQQRAAGDRVFFYGERLPKAWWAE